MLRRSLHCRTGPWATMRLRSWSAMGRAALGAAMLLAMGRAALIVMLAVLRHRRKGGSDQADYRGRDKKFVHQIHPRNVNA